MSITSFTPNDKALLHQLRLQRFVEVLADPTWYKVAVHGDRLILNAMSPCWVDIAINGLPVLLEAAYLILGTNWISLYCANILVANYYSKQVDRQEVKSMVATMDRPTTEEPAHSFVSGSNTDYVSLDQLRSMALEIGNDNEEFLEWMEQSAISIPTRFFNGVPRYRTSAIVKAATDWNAAKFQSILSKYTVSPISSTASIEASVSSPNGISNTSSAPSIEKSGSLKVLRTPEGFKPFTTGRDKYAKTIKALFDAVQPEKRAEWQQHLTTQSDTGVRFLSRLAKAFGTNDAYSELLETINDYTAHEVQMEANAA